MMSLLLKKRQIIVRNILYGNLSADTFCAVEGCSAVIYFCAVQGIHYG